jgi:hypothetical protein
MSFLLALINNENDAVLREDLQERVDIVTHKIKFMDKVPVICFGHKNQAQTVLHKLIELAGGQIVSDAAQAKTILYFEPECSIADWMGNILGLLVPEWPAVTYKQVYILAGGREKNISNLVSNLEDIAEMLHPGSFIFGNEGSGWVNFQS